MIALLVLALAVIVTIAVNILQPKVQIIKAESGSISFAALPPKFPLQNGRQQVIIKKLTSNEVQQLVKIVNKKTLHKDNPSCGFDTNTAFTLHDASGDHTFMIAQDGDGIVEEKTTGRYFYLSDSETRLLAAIFASFGGAPPYGI